MGYQHEYYIDLCDSPKDFPSTIKKNRLVNTCKEYGVAIVNALDNWIYYTGETKPKFAWQFNNPCSVLRYRLTYWFNQRVENLIRFFCFNQLTTREARTMEKILQTLFVIAMLTNTNPARHLARSSRANQ